jgi:hypothetical protein
MALLKRKSSGKIRETPFYFFWGIVVSCTLTGGVMLIHNECFGWFFVAFGIIGGAILWWKREKDGDVRVSFRWQDSEITLPFAGHRFRPHLAIKAANLFPYEVQVTDRFIELKINNEWERASNSEAFFNEKPTPKDKEIRGEIHRKYQLPIPRTLQPKGLKDSSAQWGVEFYHPRSNEARAVVVVDKKQRYESEPMDISSEL